MTSRPLKSLKESTTRMDAFRSGQFRLMLDDSWPHGVDAAVDIALLGRYYERMADHAASMARQMVFLVTGGRGWTTIACFDMRLS